MDHQMDRAWGRGGAASVTDGELLISNLNHHCTKDGIVGRKKWIRREKNSNCRKESGIPEEHISEQSEASGDKSNI